MWSDGGLEISELFPNQQIILPLFCFTVYDSEGNIVHHSRKQAKIWMLVVSGESCRVDSFHAYRVKRKGDKGSFHIGATAYQHHPSDSDVSIGFSFSHWTVPSRAPQQLLSSR